mmetsp:Transcript_78904/g.223296  ORF Transcript_78904/g.223296 Transcript_78904/m.223296 type:complete len:233 (-) Transcript_78904:94-792(-)
MDFAAMAKDMIESDSAFRDQFDRSSENFHAGVDVPVPTGGARVPESMADGAAKDWRDLPEPQLAVEPQYPPEYHAMMATYELFGKLKKMISCLNKPVEIAMRVRLQYKEAQGDDKTAMESRWKGEENNRDGALGAAQSVLDIMDPAEVSERTRSTVAEVIERGKFNFEDKETFGEYMTVLQRCNQAIFADQTKLLRRIKDAKKAAATGVAPPADGGEAPAPAAAESPAQAGA